MSANGTDRRRRAMAWPAFYISIVPTGRIVDVDVVKSSGSEEFDRSAEQAVRAVEQFKELQGMDPDLFEQDFRELEILFRPEDLRQ